MRKTVVGMMVFSMIIAALYFQPAMSNNSPKPPPPSPSNPVYIRFYQSLAQNNISKADAKLNQAADLLSQAKTEGTDTSPCEGLIDEASQLLEQAKKSIANPIYANNLALKAQKLLEEAVGCLEG